ncbi:MAG: tRNA epoxyqueuosine(34) reductase QueG [Alphaproteobacteria bacterium]
MWPPIVAEADPRSRIRDQAMAFGFDDIRFAAIHLPESVRRDLDAYLAAGLHGDMGWLSDKADRRTGPRALWPEVASVLVLGVNYAPPQDPLTTRMPVTRGTVSVYARGRDYHDMVKKRLKTLARWLCQTWPCEVKVFVDTAPVMEKPLAQNGGLGWQGRHTNLVSRRFGSWLFLGEIFTTLALAPDPPETNHCGQCRRCLEACPTRAFLGPNRLDARRCLSYLTIEHKGPIPLELRPGLGNRIYGCDICLAVCPWNRFATPTPHPEFLPRAELLAPRLADLARLDGDAFAQVFAGSPIKRIGRERLVRNVLIAIGNSADRALLPVVLALRHDPSPVVVEAAVWAEETLLSSP